ncbi:MAG: Flp pilus assembly complex ATPase component TadA, partial [Holosporales bacterium]|nr:Flp pilus assembly complex ATPase component TadA [Holosporales bacterium]
MSLVGFLTAKGAISGSLNRLAATDGNDSDSHAHELIANSGECGEEELAKLEAEYYGLEYATLEGFQKLPGLDYEGMSRLSAIPIAVSDNAIHIAISDPSDLKTRDQMARYVAGLKTGRELPHVYCIASNSAISRKYGEVTDRRTNLIEGIIAEALSESASDIHVTPFHKTFQIMLRINGELSLLRALDTEGFQSLAISLKVMAKLDIAETRRPQSGHFQRRNVDFRISTHPTMYGENIVIRILNKDRNLISIENIGFEPEQVEYLKEATSYHCGMIIFCGPTGSGKTTSIYSLLRVMDSETRNIMTLEDPVEYRIPNVRQTEIIRGVIEFADGVRSILRQDPDVILIGEIR